MQHNRDLSHYNGVKIVFLKYIKGTPIVNYQSIEMAKPEQVLIIEPQNELRFRGKWRIVIDVSSNTHIHNYIVELCNSDSLQFGVPITVTFLIKLPILTSPCV